MFPITFLAFVITSIYLFLTTGNNPGFYNTGASIGSNEDCVVITLNNEITQSHEIFIKSDAKKEENNIEMQKNNDNNKETPQEILNNNEEDPFKFCEICKIEKFLRMKHCDKCEKCVHKFDHHCFWVGGFKLQLKVLFSSKMLGACVGEMNHGRFWSFLFFQTITCLLGFIIVN